MRLNAYVAHDEEKSKTDKEYREKTLNFYAALRDFGYKVIEKNRSCGTWTKRVRGTARRTRTSTWQWTRLQSENLDKVLFATGDGDFVQVVKALQNKGCRVEAVAFQNISSNLKREVDLFMSGYLIPNLLPLDNPENTKWGEPGSKVRGICYNFNHTKNYGFVRFLRHIGPGLWITDTRQSESPYNTAFVHESDFSSQGIVNQLPNRDFIFEFDISKGEKGLQAKHITRVYPQ